MSSLKFAPNIFAVENFYDIVSVFSSEGKCFVSVGGKPFYENSSGIFKVHTTVHKIRVPQNALENAGEYSVHFFPCAEKKPYWTEFGEEEVCTYSFKAPSKTESFNIYYTADIHSCYREAEKCCSFFGDDLDLLVINGDYGESRSVEDIEELGRFIANVTCGSVPTVIGRGNHDTRGDMSELITDYIPTFNGKTYYRVNVGPISGIVLDAGEDKYDDHKEYGGVNFFEHYRRDELSFLQGIDCLDKGRYRLAFCHTPFTYTHNNDIFNIDTDVYEGWSRELERLGVEALISGHLHKYYLLPGEAPERITHGYPIIVGAMKKDSILGGSAITLMKDKILCRFTDSAHNITREFELKR